MFRESTKWAFLAVAICLGAACQRVPPGPTYPTALARFDVSESRFYVSLPPMETLREEILSLIVNADGMEGLLDLAYGTVGIRLESEELFSESGLDPRFAPLVWEAQGGVALVLGTLDAAHFEAFLLATATGAGLTPEPVETAQARLYAITPHFACALTGNLVVAYWSQGEALPGLASLLLSPLPDMVPEKPEPESAISLVVQLSPETQAIGPSDWIRELGPLAGVARASLAALGPCSRIEGTIVPGDRYLVTLETSGCNLVADQTPEPTPESWLPEDTVLLLQAGLGKKALSEVISPLQRLLIDRGWALLSPKVRILDDPQDFLSCIGGDLSLAFLGFSQTVPMDRLLSPRDPLDPLFAVHVQLGITLLCDDLWERLVGDSGLSATFKLVRSDCSSGDVSCFEFCAPDRPERCFSAVRQGPQVLVTTGANEGARAVQILAGAAGSLRKSLFAGLRKGPATLTLKTRRLVRDLDNKGFPPYFLQILSSVLEVRLTLEPGAQGTRMVAEVVLR